MMRTQQDSKNPPPSVAVFQDFLNVSDVGLQKYNFC